MSFVQQIEIDLNKIRTDPNSNVRIYKNMKLTLERIKKQALSKECGIFEEWLKTAPSIPALKASHALIKAAEARLDAIEVLGRQERLSTSELQNHVEKYGQNLDSPFELTDNGAQEPEEVLSRLMMHEEDKDRFNRKVVFDADVKYFGVAHRELDEEKHLTIIIFAKEIEDLPEVPVSDDLLARINRIRENPKSHLKDLEIAKKIDSRKKKSKYHLNECDTAIDFINKASSNPPLKSSDHLAEIANRFIEGVKKSAKSVLIGVNELKAITEELRLGEYSILLATGVYDNSNCDKILQNLVLNEYDTQNLIRRAIFDQSVKIVGIAHQEINYTPITVVVFSDKIDFKDERSFDEKVKDEINKFRENPKIVVPSIELKRKPLEKFVSKKEEVNALKDLENDLKSKQPLPKFELSNDLCQAAQDFLRQNGNSTSIFDQRVFSEEREFLATRLAHFCTGYKEVHQFVDIGEVSDLVLRLVLDENDETKSCRKAILDKKLKFIGVAESTFKNKHITTIILTDNVEALPEKAFLDALYQQINALRTNPRSFIHYYQKIVDENKNPDDVANAYKLAHFLKTTRFYASFQRNELLDKAAEARLAEIKEKKGKYKKHSQDDIRIFLSDFCSGYKFIGEILGGKYDDPTSFIVDTLLKEDFDTGSKTLIFNQKLFSIGLAYDPDLKITVVYLADNVEEPINDEIEINNHWRKIYRPNLTEDEKLQIKRDFNKLDVLNKGTIIPQIILTFINNIPDFKKVNPVYYQVLVNVSNNLSYSQIGINVEQFTDEVAKIISSFTDENWRKLFDLYIGESRKKVIDSGIFKEISRGLGFKISDEECIEIIQKLTEDKNNLDYKKFIEIMKIVEAEGKRTI